jgi:hypothetical protein
MLAGMFYFHIFLNQPPFLSPGALPSGRPGRRSYDIIYILHELNSKVIDLHFDLKIGKT